jgi:hypothetical protein
MPCAFEVADRREGGAQREKKPPDASGGHLMRSRSVDEVAMRASALAANPRRQAVREEPKTLMLQEKRRPALTRRRGAAPATYRVATYIVISKPKRMS